MANDQYAATPGSTMPPPGVGYGAPGFFSSAYGAAGFGGTSIREQQGSVLQAGATGGFGAVQAMGSAASWGMSGLMAAQMFAPVMQASGNRSAYKIGGMLTDLDPFNWVFKAGGAGFRFGRSLPAFAAGEGLIGAEAAGAGLGATALGVGTGLAAATVTAAPLVAAWYAASSAGEAFVAGGQRFTTAQQMLAGGIAGQRLSASANIRESAGLSKDIGQAALDLRTDTDQIVGIGQFLDSQKYFQSASSVTEFRAKFKQALTAIKQISKDLQVSLDEATQTFSEIRQQGFYSTSDIRAQAARQGAISAATGRSIEDVVAAGNYGAQMARSRGMHGRYGATMLQGIQAAVDSGMMAKTVSEESVMELGGSEAVAGQLAQRSMNFLQSSRGRLFAANVIGADGRIDPSRLSRVMGGMSLEGMVDGAVGRGLGTLYRAGSPEVQQQLLQYAPYAMVNQAVAQQGMTGMGLMTNLMNVGFGSTREEVRTNLQVLYAQGRAMQEQDAQQRLAAQKAQFEANQQRYGVISGMSRGWNSAMEGFSSWGSDVQYGFSSWADRQSKWWSGYREYQVGGQSAEERRRGTALLLNRDLASPDMYEETQGFLPGASDTWYTNSTRQQRLRDAYAPYLTRTPRSRSWVLREDYGTVPVGDGLYLPANVADLERTARTARYASPSPNTANVRDLLIRAGGTGSDGENLLNKTITAIRRDAWGEGKNWSQRNMMGGPDIDYALESDPNEYARVNAYAMARVAESLVPGSGFSGPYKDFKAQPAEKLRAYEVQAADVLEQTKYGGGQLDRLRAFMLQREASLGNEDFSDIEAYRKRYSEALNQFSSLKGEAGERFKEILRTSAAGRSVYSDLLDAASAPMEANRSGEVNDLQARLTDMFPGEASTISALVAEASSGGKDYSAFRSLTDVTGAAENFDAKMGQIRAARDRLAKAGKLGPHEAEVRILANANTSNEFAEGMTGLLMAYAKGGVTEGDGELANLYDVLGGDTGAFKFAEYINTAVRGDAKAQREALSNAGIKGAQLDEAMRQVKAAGGKDAQTEVMLKWLAPTGALTTDLVGGNPETTVAGMRSVELQRQREFVQAVDAFMTKFRDSPLATMLTPESPTP